MKDLLILAVDPGWSPAWALGRGDELVAYGRLRGITGKDYDRLTQEVTEVMISVLDTWGIPDVCIVEGQFIKLFNKKPLPGERPSRVISGGVLSLARSAQVWCQSARQWGVGRVIDELPPSSWQSDLGCSPRAQRSTLKLASMFSAEILVARYKGAEHHLPGGARKEGLTEDEADAICLWAYQWGQEKLQTIVGVQEKLFPTKKVMRRRTT